LGVDERLLEGVAGPHVRFARSRLDHDAQSGSGNHGAGICCHLFGFDQIVDESRGKDSEVIRLTGVDLLLKIGCKTELDFYLIARRALELRSEFFEHRLETIGA
jgi:hypothetical protein